MTIKPQDIPTGNSKEDVKKRLNIILLYYQQWKKNNSTQQIFNIHLKEYINIRNISITETAAHASKSYLSTLAVLQLDCILSTAEKVNKVKANPNKKNQKTIYSYYTNANNIGRNRKSQIDCWGRNSHKK